MPKIKKISRGRANEVSTVDEAANWRPFALTKNKNKEEEMPQETDNQESAIEELTKEREALSKEREELVKEKKELVELLAKERKAREEEQDQRLTESYLAKAKNDFSHVPGDSAALGELLKSLHKTDPKLEEQVVEFLKGAEAALAEGKVLDEAGVAADEETAVTDAWQKIEKAAKKIAEAESISEDAAVSRVFDIQPNLYNEYKREMGL